MTPEGHESTVRAETDGVATAPRPGVRSAWWAASAPVSFFAALEDAPRIARAAAVAVASGLVGALVAAVLLARATGSSPLPLLLALPAAALPYLALLSALGGLVLLRPARLDLRAWEIVLWSWAPLGFLALALLPIGLIAPAPTMIGGLLMLPPWHLWLVHAGTRVHAAGGARLAVGLYAAVVFLLPTALVLFTLAVLSTAIP